MLTRRRIIASIPAFPLINTAEAKPSGAIYEQVLEILRSLSQEDRGIWTAHIEADFILIKRKL